MRIGITYDLKDEYVAAGLADEEAAEFDRPDTIRAIGDVLSNLGHRPEPIGHVKQLAAKLVAGERWDLVFNIAEGVYGFGREAQIPALLDAWCIPYTFSDPMAMSLTLHKGMAKCVVRDCGIRTPAFSVVEDPRDLDELALPFPLFAKPVAEGTGKGISCASKVRTHRELELVCHTLLKRFKQPVLVETYLPGREFTVGLVGTGREARVLGVMEVLLNTKAESAAYGYDNKAHFEGRVEYRLTEGEFAGRLGEMALASWRALNCRDGGRLDLKLDEKGAPHFLEVNPLAGLNPEISDLAILCRLNGIGYGELVGMILDSALARIRGADEISQVVRAA